MENELFDKKVEKKADKTEITVSMTGTIPTASFENFKPLYAIKKEFEQELTDLEINNIVENLRGFVENKLNADFLRGIKKRIEKQRSDMRFYEFDGKIYPSVTSIINPFGIDYDPYLLSQYAARGTIVHKQAEKMLKIIAEGEEPKALDPKIIKTKEIQDAVKLVENGTLGLSWKDCNPVGFWKKYGDDIEVEKIEFKVKNDRYLFAGTADIVGKYKEQRAILDWKTASNYSGNKLEKYKMQLSAYAKCVGAKVGVILPLKPKNKSGFGKPIVIENIEPYWAKFLEAREKYREIYGV